MRFKGTVASAEVVYSPTMEYGIQTEWEIALHFQSPTGDSSDFMVRELPCVTREQAVAIADKWNSEVCPELVGRFEILTHSPVDGFKYPVQERPVIQMRS